MPDIDLDLEGMTQEQLVVEVKKLRAGIRQHRDAEGHNLCWWVPELWGLLPEKVDPKPRVPPLGEFLENCAKYRASLDNSTLLAPVEWVKGKGLCFKEPVKEVAAPVTVQIDLDAGIKTAEPAAPVAVAQTPQSIECGP
jgi:hypothetical protein